MKIFVFKNQAHAQDGAIDGAICSWLRDTRVSSAYKPSLIFFHMYY